MKIEEGVRTDTDLISFLMIGQSNMAGRGDLCDVEPIDNDLCFMYRIARWDKMVEPINVDKRADSEFAPGVSLGASFADAYAKHFKSSVGLIPCASGGTTVEQWMPGGDLFDNAVFTSRLAMRTSRLGGILWHQGESDSYPFMPEVYGEKFLIIMKSLREALGIPDLPIVIGELSEKITDRWMASKTAHLMNGLFHSLAAELPFCAVADARDLDVKCDGIHFTAQSQRILGQRYFEKYLSLLK